MFGFLSGPAPEPDESIPVDRPKKKKRKHAAAAPEPAAMEEASNGVKAMEVDGEKHDDDDAEDDDEPVLKRLRIDEPTAVVTDEFETEAKREVKADAGLTGGQADGAKLVLTHHVRWFLFPPGLIREAYSPTLRLDIESHIQQVTHTYQSNSMSPLHHQLANIPSP